MKKNNRKEEIDKRLTQLGRYLLTTKRKASIRKIFTRAGFDEIPYRNLAVLFISSIFITLAWYIYMILASQIKEYGILFIITTFFLFTIIFEIVLILVSIIVGRIYLDVRTYNRVQNIEENLPLFLRELSTNLKAGREFVDALEDSMTPQLGVLNDDIQKIIVDIRSGKMVEKVLQKYSMKYDSYAINETFEIILESYKGGGGLAEIIDRIAENLEVIHYLRKNAIASVANYIVFTTIVSLLIAPVLFALSYNLLWLIKTLLGRLVMTGNSSPYLNVAGRLDISFTSFKLFSRIGVAIISGSAASIIGIIRRGSLRGAPVLILIFVVI